MLSNVKIGQYIWTIKEGWTRVVTIGENSNTDYPIETEECSYAFDGRYVEEDEYPSAFLEPPTGLDVDPKPSEFYKGQRVVVWNGSRNFTQRAHFAFSDGGLYHCYIDGGNEWSSGGRTKAWEHCEEWVNE